MEIPQVARGGSFTTPQLRGLPAPESQRRLKEWRDWPPNKSRATYCSPRAAGGWRHTTLIKTERSRRERRPCRLLRYGVRLGSVGYCLTRISFPPATGCPRRESPPALTYMGRRRCVWSARSRPVALFCRRIALTLRFTRHWREGRYCLCWVDACDFRGTSLMGARR